MTSDAPATEFSDETWSRIVGGVYNLSSPKFKGIPSHWMTYMAVDDIDAAAIDYFDIFFNGLLPRK